VFPGTNLCYFLKETIFIVTYTIH